MPGLDDRDGLRRHPVRDEECLKSRCIIGVQKQENASFGTVVRSVAPESFEDVPVAVRRLDPPRCPARISIPRGRRDGDPAIRGQLVLFDFPDADGSASEGVCSELLGLLFRVAGRNGRDGATTNLSPMSG
jgi:hypothetical protein